MERNFLIVLSVFLLCGGCHSQTLWDRINAYNAPITKFKQLVSAESSLIAFINDPMTTVFVPIDSVIDKPFTSGVNGLSKAQKISLVKYHLAKLEDKDGNDVLITTSVLTDSRIRRSGMANVGVGQFVTLKSQYNNVPLYMVRSKNASSDSYEYFVNNAKFDVGNFDNTMATGVFHVVDDVIYPFGLHAALYSHLQGKSEFKTFFDLITKFKEDVTKNPKQSKLQNRFELQSDISTMFVPNNAAFAPIPKTVLDGIRNNLTRLADFLGSHLAPDQVIFASWMAYRPEVEMSMYVKELGSSINSSMYLNQESRQTFVSAGGVTAKVLGQTQPVGNGLMLIIDTPLNLLYRNVRSILQSDAPAFLAACDAIPECKAYVDTANGEVTFFAPQSFPSSLASMKTVILLHVLPARRLTVATMPVSQVKYKGAMDSGRLRFNRMVTSTWVEGRLLNLVEGHYSQGYVGSQITKADIAATNGVVQLLQSNLGYATNSIYQVLRGQYAQFSKLIGYLDSDFDIDFKSLDPNTKQHYTFFAPTNDALMAMENDPAGKVLLENSANRKALLKRLILLNTVLLSGLKLNQKYEAQTALPFSDNKYTRVKMTIFVTQNIKLSKDGQPVVMRNASINIGATNIDAVIDPSKSEYGATNGIVYTLDKVPYSSTLTAKVCEKVLCSAVARHASWALVLLMGALARALVRTV